MPIGFLADQVHNASGGFFAAHISANHDLLGRIQNGSEFDRGTESGNFDYPRFSRLTLTASCSPRDMNGDRWGTANSATRAFGVHVMRPCRGASCAYVNTALSVWVVPFGALIGTRVPNFPALRSAWKTYSLASRENRQFRQTINKSPSIQSTEPATRLALRFSPR